MKRCIRVGMGIVLIEILVVIVSLGQRPSPAAAPAQGSEPSAASKFDEPMVIQPIDRFDSHTILRGPRLAAAGAQTEFRMTLRSWIIPNRQRIERFPEQGFLIVQVRSGEDMATVIDGRRQQRKVDEYFTVPLGSHMSIETGNDTAIIQTFAMRAIAKAPAKKQQ